VACRRRVIRGAVSRLISRETNMTNFIDLLLTELSDEIEVTISPDVVSVTCKGKLESLKPVVYVSSDETNPIIIAVGSSADPSEPHIQVNLFHSGTLLPDWLDKGIVLERFFQYVFRSALNLGVLTRPRVIVRGADSLNSILCGYQKSLLKNALIKAGAGKCVFDL
jgi:hypothetical protein